MYVWQNRPFKSLPSNIGSITMQCLGVQDGKREKQWMCIIEVSNFEWLDDRFD